MIALDECVLPEKTTLAGKMKERYSELAVIHMDDFFLQPQMRTPGRLSEPGGNVDYKRFCLEVIDPLVQTDHAVTGCTVVTVRALSVQKRWLIRRSCLWKAHTALILISGLSMTPSISFPYPNKSKRADSGGEMGRQCCPGFWTNGFPWRSSI